MRQYFSRTGLIALISLNIIVLADFSAFAAKVEELMPNESMIYLTLRDLEDFWWSIEESENWKKVFAQPSLKSRIDGINQEMQMVGCCSVQFCRACLRYLDIRLYNERNRVEVNEGVYRNIKYSAVEINNLSLSTGLLMICLLLE